MNVLISPQFAQVGLQVPDQAALFDAMVGPLRAQERVRGSFRAALSEREIHFPTGLPIGRGVAIPHTDAEHVRADTIALATLAEPIRFGEMGGGEHASVDVSLVVMLALSNGSQIAVLKRVINAIRSSDFQASLAQAEDSHELAALALQEFLD